MRREFNKKGEEKVDIKKKKEKTSNLLLLVTCSIKSSPL